MRKNGSLPKGQHSGVAAAIRQAFNQPDQKNAVDIWRHLADQLRSALAALAEACGPDRLAALIEESAVDVLAHMAFPARHEPGFTAPTHWNA